MKERDFKGVWIPKSIWLDESLSITEKCLLVEIDSLNNDPAKGCFASNEYLGQFLNLSAGRAANMVSDLKKRGYIEQVFFDGRNRGLRVPILHENVKNLHENVKAAFTKTGKQPSRFREHSNTDSNTVEIESTPAQISQPKDNPIPVITSQAAPDWMDVARQMLEYSRGEGATQYRFICESMRFSGDPMPVFTAWASKAMPYELKNWKAEFRKLGTWFRNEATRGQAYKPVSNATPAAGVGISLNDYKPKV